MCSRYSVGIAFEEVVLLMNTKQELKDYLKEKGEELQIKSLFSEDAREADYRPYCKSEYELNQWVAYPDNMNLVVLNKILLEDFLEGLVSEGEIESYEQDGAIYKVRTSRYDVYLRLLHFGHVAHYTINHKTKRAANHSKSMFRDAFCNYLEKYL